MEKKEKAKKLQADLQHLYWKLDEQAFRGYPENRIEKTRSDIDRKIDEIQSFYQEV